MCGLKILLRYAVLRFAYAGESRRERRRVVNEEGREDRERGREGLFESSSSVVENCSFCRSFPRPRFSYYRGSIDFNRE